MNLTIDLSMFPSILYDIGRSPSELDYIQGFLRTHVFYEQEITIISNVMWSE